MSARPLLFMDGVQGKESLQELRRKGEAMTETEKDSWIVQLRRDVVKYREAYRLTKYQLDSALKEIKELKEKTK